MKKLFKDLLECYKNTNQDIHWHWLGEMDHISEEGYSWIVKVIITAIYVLVCLLFNVAVIPIGMIIRILGLGHLIYKGK